MATAEPGVDKEQILIGAFGPLTGPASWIGLGARDGMQIAALHDMAGEIIHMAVTHQIKTAAVVGTWETAHQIAPDPAATPQERSRAFDVARGELDGLIVLPERTRVAIERGIAGELDS